MAYRTLDINVISAKGLKNVNVIDKVDVYAIVSLKGDSSIHKQKTKTPVDKACGKNPTWNFPVKFTIDESSAMNKKLNLKFKIKCELNLGEEEVGEVNVPVMELLGSPGEGGSMKFVSYQVREPSGKPEGTLNFSYKFGDKVSEPVKTEESKGGKPVTTYPAPMAAGSSSAPYGGRRRYPPPPPADYGYPPQPVGAAYGGYPQHAPPPPPAGYGYPPQAVAAAYGGYPQHAPPAPPAGYGCPPPPVLAAYGGYPQHAPPAPGYGYPPPPPPGHCYPTVQQPPRQNSNFGLGLGADLLGGALGWLLIGDMVSDAATYDAGFDAATYDAGFDDAGGFDL